MNPQPPLGPPVPPGKHRHPATSQAFAAPLGRVGVAIVDDDESMHLLIRGNLDQTQEFQWVGSYASGEAALIGIPQCGAQVVLMEVKMPGMSGIECARRLKALHPHLVIVMITGLDDPRTINMAREAGADGFLAKPFSPGQFLATLLYCIPKSEAPGQQSGVKAGFHGRSLTARENKLMDYLAKGLLYKEMADRTGVSESAVHHMLSRIFKKLGVMNKTEAIRQWKNGNRRSP